MSEPKHIIRFREAHLKAGESIIAWGEGYIGEMMGQGDKTQHNGVLIVTGDRVVFYRKGILGEVLESIPLKKITSIERRSVLGHRTIRLHTSHDQLEFKTFHKVQEADLIQAIETGRDKGESSVVSVESLNASTEVIRKLAELRDAGVITEVEFTAKKAELLKRL